MGQPLKSYNRSEAQIVEKGNMGGTRRKIALIRAEAIASIPAPVLVGEIWHIADPIVFVDDTAEVFAQWDITKNSGDVRHELQGEIDGKSFKNFCDFNVSGNPSKILFQQKVMANEELICAIQDRLGQWRLIGTKVEPAHLNTASGQAGKAPTDVRNLMFVIEADDNDPAPVLAVPPQVLLTVGP